MLFRSKIDFREFLNFHTNNGATLSMVLVRSTEPKEYGRVALENSGRITSFKEKSIGNDECLINAGIYLMQKDIFSYMPDKNSFSLEYDVFPKLAGNNCYGFVTKKELLDIGTPERYEKAIRIFGGS